MASVAIAVAAVLGIVANPASAHAILLSANPSDGARLDAAPTSVELVFSEDVSVIASGLRVLDETGTRVDRGAIRADGPVVGVGLRPDLPDGPYIVTFRVTSADGHPVRGGLVFAVGPVAADPGLLGRYFDDGTDRAWSAVAAIDRWMLYVGGLGAAGLALAAAGLTGGRLPRGRATVSGLAALCACAAVVALPVAAAQLTGRGPTSLSETGVLEAVWGDGALGVSLLLVLAGSALAVISVTSTRPVPPAVSAVLSMAIGAGISGHSRSSDSTVAAVASATAHTAVAAIWFGGLLGAALFGRSSAPERLAYLRRFSSWAAASVLVLAVAGSAMAWLELRSLSAVDTAYGRLLVVKVAVVAVVLVVASLVRRRLSVDDAGADRFWGRGIRFEAVGLVAVLALTAILVNVTPGRVEAGVGGIVTVSMDLDDRGRVDVVVDPARAGAVNTMHLYVFDESGRIADAVEAVVISLSLADADVGPLRRDPFRAGPAHFQLTGDELAIAGRWELEVQVRLSRFESITASTEVQIR